MLDHVFVCPSCDESKGGIASGQHKATHTLAWIYVPLEVPLSPRVRRSSRRINSYDDDDDEDIDDEDIHRGRHDPRIVVGRPTRRSLKALAGRITTMENRFGAVEDRLGRMEGMLEAALSLLRTTPTSQGP